jgi:hypothetical protein
VETVETVGAAVRRLEFPQLEVLVITHISKPLGG